MDEEQWKKQLQDDGFVDLQVVSLHPNFIPGEHTHEQETTHVILKGALIITDKQGQKSFEKGSRVDFPAGTKHSAAVGPDGCTMIVGFKK